MREFVSLRVIIRYLCLLSKHYLVTSVAYVCFCFQAIAAPLAELSLPAPEQGFEPSSFINYETPHVHPLDITPNNQNLLAVNTADNSLMVFDISQGSTVQVQTIPVGLDPVSVRARTNSEVWVVNHLSDTISIIDLDKAQVVNTLHTDDEPADVVFAGNPQKAFVSASQVNKINVFNLNNLQQAPQQIMIAGEDPRMLAVSPDGETVYVAIFESGNATTILAGGKSLPRIDDVVSNPQSPYGGSSVIPNAGTGFVPLMNPNNPPPPPVSIIVRKQDDEKWFDDNLGDWSRFVSGDLAAQADRVPGWDLPDRDVAIINANTLSVNYQTRLMNLVMAIAVKPDTGDVTVVGSDAINEVRFEPVLNGQFIRTQFSKFSPGAESLVLDLNPHLDYTSSNIPQAQRDLSIGDPRGIAWNSAGDVAYVTGMGSNNVLAIDENGVVLERIEVGQGPTGIVISNATNLVYVLNKFDGSISVFDASAQDGSEDIAVETISFFDPTPMPIKQGRPFLYDTHATSGLGHIACASCHADGRTDRLAWDLGNPAGEMETRADPNGQSWTFHPMKGPMKTQTLQDIIGSPSLHHRGDKEDLFGFANAFANLQGDDAPLGNDDMTLFEAFIDSIHFPPNPYRRIDNWFSDQVEIQGPSSTIQRVGDAAAGFGEMQQQANRCLSCHNNERGRSDTQGPNGLHDGQPAIAEPIGGFYDRMGFFWADTQGSTSGFGFRTDGTQDSTFREENTSTNVLAAFLSWDGPKPLLQGLSRDSHAGVGQQVQLSAASDSMARELVTIANSGNIGLVVHGIYQGQQRGFMYTGSNRFQADSMGQILAYADLLEAVNQGDNLIFTLVARGSEYRLGVDADLDGLLNNDDSAPRSQAITDWQSCAEENQSCDFSGTAIVRYGAQDQWLYGVFSDGVSCANDVFGDPLPGILKRCELTNLDDTPIDEILDVSISTTSLSRGGFEIPDLATGQFQYQLPDSIWTYIGGAGVSENRSGFTHLNPNAPQGTQIAFIQGTGSKISRSVNLQAGTYKLVMSAAQRAVIDTSPQTIQVLINGIIVSSLVPPSTSYTRMETTPFFVAQGQHTLELIGLNLANNTDENLIASNTAFIDDLSIESIDGIEIEPAEIFESGFESPAMLLGSFEYAPAGSNWAYDVPGSGISANNSAFTYFTPAAPQGNQVGIVQVRGQLSRQVTLSAGSFKLSLQAIQRQNYAQSPQTIEVLIDDEVVGRFTPSGGNYRVFSSDSFTLEAGTYTVTIRGTSSADSTAFIDNLSIEPIQSSL